jgi:hypothetical protein
MKPFLFLILFGMLGFMACQSNSTTNTEETGAEAALPPNNPVEAPAQLAPLFNTTAGVFRGMDFSMDMQTTLAKEQTELVEQVDNVATYSVDFSETEFADITYQSNGTHLNKIQVDIYAETPESAAVWHRELKAFFDQKYTPRTDQIWDGSENGTVFSAYLSLIEEAEAPGVLIVWEPVAQ